LYAGIDFNSSARPLDFKEVVTIVTYMQFPVLTEQE
jgi:hypothetical protein